MSELLEEGEEAGEATLVLVTSCVPECLALLRIDIGYAIDIDGRDQAGARVERIDVKRISSSVRVRKTTNGSVYGYDVEALAIVDGHGADVCLEKLFERIDGVVLVDDFATFPHTREEEVHVEHATNEVRRVCWKTEIPQDLRRGIHEGVLELHVSSEAFLSLKIMFCQSLVLSRLYDNETS